MEEIKQPERLLAMDNILKRRKESLDAWAAFVERDIPKILVHLADHGSIKIHSTTISPRLPCTRATLRNILEKHGLTEFSLIVEGKGDNRWFEVSLLNQHTE